MARASSARLRVMLENGSGDGVTAARRAVLPPWAARAMAAPRAAASNCSPGVSWRWLRRLAGRLRGRGRRCGGRSRSGRRRGFCRRRIRWRRGLCWRRLWARFRGVGELAGAGRVRSGPGAQDGYCGVDVQAGGEGYGGQDGEEFGERDLEEVEHARRRRLTAWPESSMAVIAGLEALRYPRLELGDGGETTIPPLVSG